MPVQQARSFVAVDFTSLLRHSRAMLGLFRALSAFFALRIGFAAIVAAFGFFASQQMAHAQVAFESAAEQAILIEYNTGAVLYEKNADTAVIPASMAKLMTIELLFEELDKGRLKLSDQMTASENAWRKGGAPAGGSAMMLVPGARPSVEDLIRGLIVVSGNDAAITVAEGIAGSEDLFAKRMTERAKELGLKNTRYSNATGFDAPEQRTTLRDLAKLAGVIIRQHPQFYPYFKEAEYTWNKTKQANRNGLLAMEGLGADGLKTGFLEASGYGLVGSAVQQGRRLIVVVHGIKTVRDRTQEATKLLEWGFRSFEERTLFEGNKEVALIDVHGGELPKVGVAPNKAIRMLLPRGDLREITVEVRFNGPVAAPITKGAEVARLVVLRGASEISSEPLFAIADVPLGSLSTRAFDTLWALTVGGIRSAFSGAGSN
jgi:serine-type D-Ala-D-Ala carboxypeptidase (penicillin-binding protein 5/6)